MAKILVFINDFFNGIGFPIVDSPFAQFPSRHFSELIDQKKKSRQFFVTNLPFLNEIDWFLIEPKASKQKKRTYSSFPLSNDTNEIPVTISHDMLTPNTRIMQLDQHS